MVALGHRFEIIPWQKAGWDYLAACKDAWEQKLKSILGLIKWIRISFELI